MIKITLLQYIYYYDKMTINDEKIEHLGNTTKIATSGELEGKQCTLIDFERLTEDACYLVIA